MDAYMSLLGVLLGGALALAGGYLSRSAERREAEASRQADVLRMMIAHESGARHDENRTPEEDARLQREANEGLFDAWLVLPRDLLDAYSDLCGDRLSIGEFMEIGAERVRLTRMGWIKRTWVRLRGDMNGYAPIKNDPGV